MQQPSGLDGAFLAMETASVFGHVGSVCIIDPTTSSVPVTSSDSVSWLAPDCPWCRRLAPVPFGLDQPYWIEDPDFDLKYHVREIAVPAPGTDTMLAEHAARLHARPLDRARPLWEMYLISGLSGGRMAVYPKVHHTAIDGVSGVDILGTMQDTTPQPREVQAPPNRVVDRHLPAGRGSGAAHEPGRTALLSRRCHQVPTAVPGNRDLITRRSLCSR